MYMKLQIYTQSKALRILEQIDAPCYTSLCDVDGVCVKSVHGPEIAYWNSHVITFYIRGDQSRRDFAVVNYHDEKALYKILKALATIATVDIIWS